ncbi:MAG: hypothetical protein KGJ06_05465 [Pseudomonadota bacterium]|nr:hypothetical protein [Pseudomonadota bacterium]
MAGEISHKLSPKQVKSIHLLARGLTAVEVARRLRLRRETLSRWKKIPEFAALFEKVMTEQRDSMKHRLTQLIDASITTMTESVKLEHCTPNRFQAAFSVLKLLGIEQAIAPGAATPDKNPSGTDKG